MPTKTERQFHPNFITLQGSATPGTSRSGKILECRGGILVRYARTRPAVIIAETWPAWWGICSQNAGSHLVASAHGVSGKITQWPAGEEYQDDIWCGHPKETLFFLSGTVEFVERVLGANRDHLDFVYALDLGNKPSAQLNQSSGSFALKHLDYGGVTSGFWWFGTNIRGMIPPPKAPSMLRVGHILNDMELGRPSPPPDDPEAIHHEITYVNGSKILHPGSPIPIRALRSQVLCYSVYSSTKWVTRSLTTQELGRCLEVNEAALVGVKTCPVSTIPLDSLGFTNSAPARLTQAVAQNLPGHLRQGDQGAIHGDLERTKRRVEPDETEAFEDTFGRMKAAKNDDADVSIMHWDARVLAPWFGNERFVQRLEAFSIRFATDVLAVMRSIALSRWRRNLLRSLSRYMSKTYHQQWTTKPRDRSLHNDWVQDIHAGRDC
jgi:hypothetical protein